MPVTATELIATANAAVPRISGAEAVALAKRPGVVILDVREAHEVQASGHAPGAVTVPRGSLEFKADPGAATGDATLQGATTVIVHCAAGSRAALAGKLLKDMGYKDVRNLGRFKEWVEAGGAVEK